MKEELLAVLEGTVAGVSEGVEVKKQPNNFRDEDEPLGSEEMGGFIRLQIPRFSQACDLEACAARTGSKGDRRTTRT